MSRREQVLAGAVEAFARGGLHGLTHSEVDRCGGVPAGSTSNYFRTRMALVSAVVERVGELRLHERPGHHDRALALAWFELLIHAEREEWIKQAIAPLREQMRRRVAGSIPADSTLTAGKVMAVATGIEFAETVTGEDIREVVLAGIPGGHTRH